MVGDADASSGGPATVLKIMATAACSARLRTSRTTTSFGDKALYLLNAERGELYTGMIRIGKEPVLKTGAPKGLQVRVRAIPAIYAIVVIVVNTCR